MHLWTYLTELPKDALLFVVDLCRPINETAFSFRLNGRRHVNENGTRKWQTRVANLG